MFQIRNNDECCVEFKVIFDGMTTKKLVTSTSRNVTDGLKKQANI